jgi:DENN (AEX-3) domain
MIFTEGQIALESTPKIPKYFSTITTNELGNFTHIHCLITYECISPKIIISSKDRTSTLSSLSFLSKTYESEESSSEVYYVPVALCLATTTGYIDLFREILETLYSFLLDIKQSNIENNSLIVSTEFIRTVCMLINDTIIPPYDLKFSLRIGGRSIEIPVENSIGLPHIEKCIAVLLDLIDIRNIIEVWECIILNKCVFFMSYNEYLLYLILEAFKQLLFPFKWSLCIVPVLGPSLFTYLETPVPILIGLNSSHFTVQEALKGNPIACILDIDSNLLHNSNTTILCNCQKAIISKKLQLLKAYYYVNKDRLSSYRMNSLEANIDDVNFVNIAKTIIEANPKDAENIFIALVKHTFLDFFIQGIGRCNKYFLYDSFKESFEFDKTKFLQSIKTCDSCKMKEFWNEFIASISFQQFLSYEGKFDDSYYKRYFDILDSLKKDEYSIINNNFSYSFEVSNSITPRKLLSLIKKDINSKPKTFHNDSIQLLINEFKKILLAQFKEYYKQGHGRNYKSQRKPTFADSTSENEKFVSNFLYYGKYGIIRLCVLLISNLSSDRFKDFSQVDEYILPKLRSDQRNNSLPGQGLILKLFYLIRKAKSEWDVPEVVAVLKEISSINDSSFSLRIVAGILEQVFIKDQDQTYYFSKLPGSIGLLSKMLHKTVTSPVVLSRLEVDKNKEGSDKISDGSFKRISYKTDSDLSDSSESVNSFGHNINNSIVNPSNPSVPGFIRNKIRARAASKDV